MAMTLSIASSQLQTEHINYVKNPGSGATGPGVSWVGNFEGGSGSTSVTYPATGLPSDVSDYATRLSWTVASASFGAFIGANLISALPVGIYYASMWVKTSSARNMQLSTYSGTTAVFTWLSRPIITTVADTWQEVEGWFEVTVAGNFALCAICTSGAVWAIGQNLSGSSAIVAPAINGTRVPWFSGEQANNEEYDGMVVEWEGSVSDSRSILYSYVEYGFEASAYSIAEDSSPTLVLDSSGSVGSFGATIGVPEDPTHPVRMYGHGWLIGKSFTFEDTRYGILTGEVETVSGHGSRLSISGSTRLGQLNVYSIQAQPVSGTLEDAFVYYLSLAGITSGYEIDPTVASRPVNYTGWNGELWYHLKMMASAQLCDILLLSGVITLRPVREREVEVGYTTQVNGSVGGGSSAQGVEVYYYQTNSITDELVYPPGGWNPEVEILNVNAGETVEHTIDLGASLSEFQEPVMEEFVDSDYDASSVYTIVADDGLPLSAEEWTGFGGSVTFALNPDTTSMTVTMTGPTGVPTISGDLSKSFSLALASDTSGNRYSTLRIVGTGVSFTTQKLFFPTGLTEQQTGTRVGVTIDNPFLNDIDNVTQAGLQAAKSYTGLTPSLSASVLRVNLPDSSDPTLGNIAGARFWDEDTRRWYRIRSASITPAGINCDSADDDLLHSDIDTLYTGLTYADVQTLNEGLTYREVRLAGART